MTITVEHIPSVRDAMFWPDQVATWLTDQQPSSEHAVLIAALDANRLSHSGRLATLEAVDSLLAQFSAQREVILASMMHHPTDVLAQVADDTVSLEVLDGFSTITLHEGIDDARFTDEQWQSLVADVSCVTRTPSGTVQSQLNEARRLRDELPATLTALGTGRLSRRHAAVITELTNAISDSDVLAQIEQSVLDKAHTETPAAFRRSVARAVAVADPDGEHRRHLTACRQRHVTLTPLADGMASIWALLPALDAHTLMEAIRLRADHDRAALSKAERTNDLRTADERRADALVALATDVVMGPPPTQPGKAHHGGRKPHLQVTVALSTLLSLNERPAHLSGYGPISAALARELADDPSGTWRRLVTDPVNGQLLEYGRQTYRPPTGLRRFVTARDQVCSFPTCQYPAEQADLDHLVPFPVGPTNAANLHPLCRRHHRLKHETRWKVEAADGGYDWTSPTGRRYHKSRPVLHELDYQSTTEDSG